MFDWAVIGARLLQFLSSAVLFGSALFYLYGLDAGRIGTSLPQPAWRHRLLLIASIVAFVGTLLWFMAETASLSGDPADALRWSALWPVLSETHFGQFGALRLILLAVSIGALLRNEATSRQWIMQAALGGILVSSFAWSGHGAMNAGVAGLLHMVSDVSHLLAASMWIGALFPMSILLLQSSTERPTTGTSLIVAALGRFSGIGPAIVAILVLTGLINTGFLVGLPHWPELWSSPYCRTLIAKLGLFALMLTLAGINRYGLMPELTASHIDGGSFSGAVRRLRASVLTETALAVLVLAAVAVLGTLEPPVSAQ